jgi:hypothetical protein
VSLRRRYLAGLLLALTAQAVGILLVPAPYRADAAWGAVIALLIQGPLGWWVLRSIGRPRFQLVWTLGMGIRLAVIALTGIVLAPALHWDATTALGSMTVAMLMLLAAEVVTAMREHT